MRTLAGMTAQDNTDKQRQMQNSVYATMGNKIEVIPSSQVVPGPPGETFFDNKWIDNANSGLVAGLRPFKQTKKTLEGDSTWWKDKG